MNNATKELKNQIKVGELVEGKIIKIGRSEIWVDLDGLATGLIRGPELEDELGENKNLKVGDTISATVIDRENEKGAAELSLRRASHFKVWQKLKKIKDTKETVKVKIMDANKGGLLVSYGKIEGFIPASQLSSENYPQVEDGNKEKILSILKSLISKILDVKIITVDERERKVIFSEKEIEMEKRKGLFKKYNVGDVVDGKVVGISPFGAFIEFGESLKGLIHISELSWQRIEDIEKIISVGEKVKAKIISFDDAKISLSLKRLSADPWENIGSKYQVGQKVKGKISKISPYGIFVELDKDIQGLAHISEVPKELLQKKELKPGDEREFKIISLEPGDHRLGLSLKD
jgi:small subunit ribosomal protein S1